MGNLDRWPGLAGVDSMGPASLDFPRVCREEGIGVTTTCIFILGASTAEGLLSTPEVDTERNPSRREVCRRESKGPMGQEELQDWEKIDNGIPLRFLVHFLHCHRRGDPTK